jgi:chemotaxis protein methyltransferase CheR
MKVHMEGAQYAFTDEDFARVRSMIARRAGITLNETKSHMAYNRLTKRIRDLGLSSFHDYLAVLEDERSPEWEDFVNALTTNLTYFFREDHQFEILQKSIKTLRAAGSRRRLQIWSAGCSSGEEPYSIAMIVREVLGDGDIHVDILATDIGSHVLEQARRAIYPTDRLHLVSMERMKRFFMVGVGKDRGTFQVIPEVRSLVRFARHNLLDEQYFSTEGPFDFIFCRNVLIYFDRANQRRLLGKFAKAMRPHAMLFCGHAESVAHLTGVFRTAGRNVLVLAGAAGGDSVSRSVTAKEDV